MHNQGIMTPIDSDASIDSRDREGFVQASVKLKAYQRNIRVDDVTLTITLPSAADCQGKLFSIFIPAIDTSRTITIADATSDPAYSLTVTNKTNHLVLLYCDGKRFIRLTTQLS